MIDNSNQYEFISMMIKQVRSDNDVSELVILMGLYNAFGTDFQPFSPIIGIIGENVLRTDRRTDHLIKMQSHPLKLI